MALIKGLSGVINLRPEEQKSFRSLFLLSLITGIGLSYYFVAVNTFLIQKASVSNLPYAYIISGLGGVLLIKIYQHRQRKGGIINSYRESVIAFFLVAASVFMAFSKLGDNPGYAVYLAYLGFLFNMPFTIIFALSFSAICARLYNMAQSKRLLALVGTGEIIASIIGYLTAPLISDLTGSPNYLLLLASACILPALIPIYKLASENQEKLNHILVAKAALKKLDLSFFSNEKFYVLIAIVSVFSVSAIYFVDYSYLISVRFMSEYSGIEIATILGFFFSIVKIGELLFSFLSGHILSTQGVKFSILLLPVLLTSCFIFATTGSLLFQGEPVFILSFIFLAKFGERVIRKAISTPAIKVLYQVTGPDRLRIEATIEGVLNQVATVISGILLLVFSGLFAGFDPLVFLGIISAVCFVLFLAWAVLSLKLHENYKKKIWTYLTEIRSDTGSKIKEKRESDFEKSESIHASTDLNPLSQALNKALNAISESRKTGDLSQLVNYSPRALNHIESDDKELLNRKIISSYYSTDNFFHRLLVINFLRAGRQKFSTKLLKDLGEISDLQLKYELLTAYNKDSIKPNAADIFYFENLCEKYGNELILAMSAQFDLQEIDDPELQSELKVYIDMLIRVLFELLKVLYDPSAIQVIYEIITSEENQDIESRLFALELLDNILNDELKKRLIPIFEPAPFEQKINRLQKFVPVHSESKEKKLKELLMKDFTLVNAGLKEACLTAYYSLTKDEAVINAFLSSKIMNLKSRASQLLNEDDRSIKDRMIAELKENYHITTLQCAYLFNQAVQISGSKVNKTGVIANVKTSNPYLVDMGLGLILDTYALALFIDKNQSGA
ncbi:MAG: MFS transporter [Daejeonella sp.]|uniref:MFS transporter n=1 Tax=Daejeonella sp. TaxID=2805397 RepID=UPI002732BBF6|nr:MFS transporter [Daejeonella sp.]MDP3466721.1 MFS transporter [Daejeonella sp.]